MTFHINKRTSFPICIIAVFLLAVLNSLHTNAQLPSVEWGTYYDVEKAIPTGYFQSDEELIDQIAIDGAGADDYIYVVGRTSSINKSLSGSSWQNVVCAGDTIATGNKTPAAFLAKYNKSGDLLWSRFIGTDVIYPNFTTTYGYCLTIDHINGETIIYVGGEMAKGKTVEFKALSCGSECTEAVYDNEADDDDEGFIAKYNADGDLLRWTYVGGSINSTSNSTDEVLSIAVHPISHEVYVTGYTESSNFGSSGQQSDISHYDNSLSGKGDLFVASFNSCLQMTWYTYYGGDGIVTQTKKNNGQERGHGIKIYNNGSDDFLVISATVESSNLAVNANYDNSYGGTTSTNEDAFLMRWDINNLNAGPAWANYLGTSPADRGRALDLDADGNIYWTGRTSSTGLAYPSSCSNNLVQSSKGAKEDAFIAKFDKNGYAKWITYFGSNGDEEVNGIKYYMPPCPPALIIISGLTSSTNFPHVPANYSHSLLNGGNPGKYDDAFIAAVEDRDVCTTQQTIKFSTYLGGKNDEHSNASLSYGPYVEIGRNMYVSYSTKSKESDMLDNAGIVKGTFNKGCCGGISNTDAFIEKFQPFDLCRTNSSENFSSEVSPVLNCYPTPFAEDISCTIVSKIEENIQVTIFDVFGNEVEKKLVDISEGANQFSFHLAFLPQGIYFIKAKINDEIHVAKIIKQ